MKARNSKDVYVYYTTADNAGNPDQPPAELSVSMEGVTGQTWIMDSAVKSGKVLGVNQEPWESGSLEQLFPDTLSDADKNKLVFPWFMGLAGNLSSLVQMMTIGHLYLRQSLKKSKRLWKTRLSL